MGDMADALTESGIRAAVEENMEPRRRVLLIGLQRSLVADKYDDAAGPLAGTIGKRLAACAGLAYDEYLRRFDRINLLAWWTNPRNRNERRTAARLLLNTGAFVGRPAVVLLGRDVADAFWARPDTPWFAEMHTVGNANAVYVAPHPSGRNRWWNDPGNQRRARAFWHRMAVLVDE